MATANEELFDAAVSHQIGLTRYSTATVRKIVALLERVDTRLVERLARVDLTDLSREQQERLLAAIRRIIADGTGDIEAALTAELRALAGYEAEYQADLFRAIVPVRLDLELPSTAQLWAAVNSRPFQGRFLQEWFRDFDAAAMARVRNAIRAGIVEGLTTPQVIRELRGTRANGYRDGLLEITRRQAEATVRTAVNHTANAAREHLFERNASVIKGVRWVSTLDGRTSAVCRARDGKVYPLKKGPRPPAHPNCRSATVPVLKSWRELGLDLATAPEGTRASMDGQVPGATTYEAWLRAKPRTFQDDVLGEAKAKLWREGGLSLDRFVDRAGMEYTLDELRRRDREAFERAGL